VGFPSWSVSRRSSTSKAAEFNEPRRCSAILMEPDGAGKQSMHFRGRSAYRHTSGGRTRQSIPAPLRRSRPATAARRREQGRRRAQASAAAARRGRAGARAGALDAPREAALRERSEVVERPEATIASQSLARRRLREKSRTGSTRRDLRRWRSMRLPKSRGTCYRIREERKGRPCRDKCA